MTPALWVAYRSHHGGGLGLHFTVLQWSILAAVLAIVVFVGIMAWRETK